MERVLPLEYSGQTRDAPKHSATHRNPLFSAQQRVIWLQMSTVVRFRNIEFDGCMWGGRRDSVNQFSRSIMSNSLGNPMNRSTPGLPSITNPQSLPKLMSNESVMPSSHLILCCPLLLLHSIFPSIRVFSMSQVFSSGGQCIGVSPSTSVLPKNSHD